MKRLWWRWRLYWETRRYDRQLRGVYMRDMFGGRFLPSRKLRWTTARIMAAHDMLEARLAREERPRG